MHRAACGPGFGEFEGMFFAGMPFSFSNVLKKIAVSVLSSSATDQEHTYFTEIDSPIAKNWPPAT